MGQKIRGHSQHQEFYVTVLLLTTSYRTLARTLTRITSKVASQKAIRLLQNVLLNNVSYQRRCVVLLDDIYITLLLHTMEVPCSENHLMTLCFVIGTGFIAKILPVSQLTADYILNQVQHIVDEMNKQENRDVIGIIADGNRTNQKFFNNLRSNDEKPQLAGNDTFLLIHAYCYLR